MRDLGAGDRTIVNLGCDAGYTTIYICQNLEKHIAKSVNFTVCILYLKLRVLRLKKKKSCDMMGSNCLMGTEFPFRAMKIFGNG